MEGRKGVIKYGCEGGFGDSAPVCVELRTAFPGYRWDYFCCDFYTLLLGRNTREDRLWRISREGSFGKCNVPRGGERRRSSLSGGLKREKGFCIASAVTIHS